MFETEATKILKAYQLDIASKLSDGLVLDYERDTARQEALQALTALHKREVLKAVEADEYDGRYDLLTDHQKKVLIIHHEKALSKLRKDRADEKN